MEMKFLKRGLAVFLTAALMMPAQPLVVANALPMEAGIKQTEREKTEYQRREPGPGGRLHGRGDPGC